MNLYSKTFSREKDFRQYYYYYIFPADLIVQLFGKRRDQYNGRVHTWNREVAIRLLQRSYKKSVFSRYYTPANSDIFKDLIINNIPTDVYIGPGYNYSPRSYKALRNNSRYSQAPVAPKIQFHSRHHEFVMDLDLTDYDLLRTCCKQREICPRCWPFMAVACELLDDVLRYQVAAFNVLWVYSGGRGLHCWCFDKKFLTMSKGQRSDLLCCIQEMLLPKDQNVAVVRHYLDNSPMVARAYKTSRLYLSGILREQNPLAQQHGKQFLLDYMDIHLRGNEMDKCVRRKILKLLGEEGEEEEHGPPENVDAEEWAPPRNTSEQIMHLLEQRAVDSVDANMAVKRVVLNLMHPRIDAPVSNDVSHLLRCPFSVHTGGGSGTIVLPVDRDEVAHVLTEHDGVLRLYPAGGTQHAEPERLWDELGASDGARHTVSGRFDRCKKILERLFDKMVEDEYYEQVEREEVERLSKQPAHEIEAMIVDLTDDDCF